jgi:hypothetical protein
MRVFAGAVCAMLGCSEARGASCRWTGASAPDAAPVSFECRAALFGTSVSSLAFDAPLALAVPPDACSEAVTCKGGCQGKVVLAVRGKCPFYQKALAVMRSSEGQVGVSLRLRANLACPRRPTHIHRILPGRCVDHRGQCTRKGEAAAAAHPGHGVS